MLTPSQNKYVPCQQKIPMDVNKKSRCVVWAKEKNPEVCKKKVAVCSPGQEERGHQLAAQQLMSSPVKCTQVELS